MTDNVAVDVLIVVVVLLLQRGLLLYLNISLVLCNHYNTAPQWNIHAHIRAHVLRKGSFMQFLVLIYKVIFHVLLLRFLLSCNNYPC